MNLPYAKAVTGLVDEQNDLCIEFKAKRYAIGLDGAGHHDFWNILSLMNGARSFEEIAEQSGIETRSLEKMAGDLAALGLVGDAADSAATAASIDAPEFLANIEAAARNWKNHVLRRPLFAALVTPGQDPGLLTGLLLETHHYIGLTERAIRLAADHHRDHPAGKILDHIRQSEAGHQKLIGRCLAAIGFDVAQLDAMQPIYPTVSVGSFVTAQAQTSTECFLALFLLSEAREDEREGSLRFIEDIEAAFELGAGALDGLRQHLLADLAENHCSLLDQYLADRSHVERAMADAIVAALHTYKHLMDLWYDGILERYRRGIGILSSTPRYRDIA